MAISISAVIAFFTFIGFLLAGLVGGVFILVMFFFGNDNMIKPVLIFGVVCGIFCWSVHVGLLRFV